MNNRRKFYKNLSLCAALVFAILSSALPVCAAVYTSKDDFGEADTVYVAGKPDAYPLEYYSEEKKAYCGVFPDMLEAVSEKTNISFTYISASDENMQKELARNNQVEMVTALLIEEDEYEVIEILPVIETSYGGEKKTYGIGFTETAEPELVEKIESAFSEISEEEKMGYLLDNSGNDTEAESRSGLIKIMIFLSAAVSIVICVIIAVTASKRKKQSSRDLKIDELTGIGNAKYYEYAFEQLISRQSRNLYAVVYLAFESEKIGNKYGREKIE